MSLRSEGSRRAAEKDVEKNYQVDPQTTLKTPWKNEGFKVLMPKDMDYNPQKMKVLGSSRGCKTSSENVAWLKMLLC